MDASQIFVPLFSNHRLQKMSTARRIPGERWKVNFTYKDYMEGLVTKTMQPAGMEFIHRAGMHILANGFERIRLVKRQQ